MNTGMPASKVAKKTKIRIGIAWLSVRVNLLDYFRRLPPAILRVAPDHLDLPRQHHEAAEPDDAVDDAHRQFEHRHGLRMHALDDGHREIRQQRHEAERDEID